MQVLKGKLTQNKKLQYIRYVIKMVEEMNYHIDTLLYTTYIKDILEDKVSDERIELYEKTIK